MSQEVEISPCGLMDLQNAARYVGVKVDTIRWLRRTRKIPFVRLGARLMVSKSDLDAFIEAAKEPAIN